MNKAKEIAFWKQQQAVAQNLKLVAEQQIAQATQIESEAKSRLAELGGSAGRARKGKVTLPDNIQLSLKASMTNKKPAVGAAG